MKIIIYIAIAFILLRLIHIISYRLKAKNRFKNLNKKEAVSLESLLEILFINFMAIKDIEDLKSLLVLENFRDISASPEVKMINRKSKMEGDQAIENHFWEFRESLKRYGILDIDFSEGKLTNLRIQLFDKEEIVGKEYLINIKNVLEKIGQIYLRKNSDSHALYDYMGESSQGYKVALRQVNNNSISVAITRQDAVF